MKNIAALIFALFIGNALFGQMYFQFGPDSKWESADSAQSPLFEALRALATTEQILLVDSIVFTWQDSTYVGHSKSALVNTNGSQLLNGWRFSGPRPHQLALVLKSDVTTTTIQYYQRINSSDMCKEVKGNLLFYKACMAYEVDRNLSLIFAPDDVEGHAGVTIVVNEKGLVISVAFDHFSTNPHFNDFLKQELSEMIFPAAGIIEGKVVPYSYKFTKSAYLPSEDSAQMTSDLQKAIESRQWAEVLFRYKKLIHREVKVDSTATHQAGLAAYFLKDQKKAIEIFSKNLTDGALENSTLVIQGTDEDGNPLLVLIDEVDQLKQGIDLPPLFPGCKSDLDFKARLNCFQMGLMRHVATTFRFPKEARDQQIQGRVFVNFMIDANGRAQQLQIERSIHYLIDLEALRVVSELPKMDEPALQKGKPVQVSYTLPINAKIK
jgi:TonB family protein